MIYLSQGPEYSVETLRKASLEPSLSKSKEVGFHNPAPILCPHAPWLRIKSSKARPDKSKHNRGMPASPPHPTAPALPGGSATSGDGKALGLSQ